MKIAILTSGILPVPAVQGGAVENLIDFYLEYNNIHCIHDITVYSIYHPKTRSHPLRKSNVNHFYYIDVDSFLGRIKRKIYQYFYYNIGKGYYNHFIEYYYHVSFRQIKKHTYDIIIMENRPAYALKLRKHTKAKLICHLHNDLLQSNTLLAKQIYDSLDSIITVSNYISNCVRTIQQNDQKCITVYNGIDTNNFTPNYKSTIEREMIGLNKDDFVLLYSGRINQEKGIVELIKAMSLLHEYMQIKLLIIGGSFFGNEMIENDFITHIRKMAEPIKNNIIFTGFIPYEDMPNYLKIANIAVVPSIWNDPFPTTVLEAQAVGLPIITTMNGGIPEEVTNENAILLQTNESFVENLAQSILFLYQNPNKCKDMSRASIHNSKEFNKERYAKDFFKALDSLIDTKL